MRSVSILNSSVPYVVALGAPRRDVRRGEEVVINSAAHIIYDCGEPSMADLEFFWTVKNNNVLVRELVSTSNNPATFRLPANSLEVGEVYYVYVQAVDTVTDYSVQNFVQLSVIAGDLVSKIQIASDLTVATNFGLFPGTSQQLTGAGSYDSDYEATSNLQPILTYRWTCRQMSPVVSSTCSMALVGVDGETLTISNILVNSTSELTLTVS